MNTEKDLTGMQPGLIQAIECGDVRDYRKEMWIAAYAAAYRGTGSEYPTHVADVALAEFDKRFPK